MKIISAVIIALAILIGFMNPLRIEAAIYFSRCSGIESPCRGEIDWHKFRLDYLEGRRSSL
jgi:hypothetical protein